MKAYSNCVQAVESNYLVILWGSAWKSIHRMFQTSLAGQPLS